MSRPTIIAGNWKLNPPRLDGQRLLEEVADGLSAREPWPESLEVVLMPPLPYLGEWSARSDSAPFTLGAQFCSLDDWGAFTGEVGAPLLAEFGAQMILVGHSERRQRYFETDTSTCARVHRVIEAGIKPCLCVGETEAERDADETFEVVDRQLSTGLEGVSEEAEVVIAYEPVWAIGTGRSATPQQAAEVHRAIRSSLERQLGDQKARQTAILYGGSVKPGNASGLLADPDIDGALVGGASLAAEDFLGIIDQAIETRRSGPSVAR